MADNIVDFIMKVRRLDSIERCANTPHISKYPVSVHSYYTALYAMMFADIENDRFIKLQNFRGIINPSKRYDTSEVIKKALIHDLEEAITGDILFPVKHNNSQTSATFKAIACKCIETEGFSGLPEDIQRYYKKLWYESKDETEEGKLVSAIDKFELLVYSITEILLGNKQFGVIIDKSVNIIMTHYSNIESVVEATNQLLNLINEEVNNGINIRNIIREVILSDIKNQARVYREIKG